MPPSSTETKAPPSSSLPQQTQAASQPNGTQPNANGPSHEATQNASPEEEAPPRKRPRKRGPPISRFKAFDDEFDIDAIAPYEPPEESVGSEIYPSQDAGLTPMSMDEPSQISRLHSHVSKRGKSPKDDDAMVDGLLPAAAAMKRRKVEIEQKKKQGQSTEQNAERGKQTMQKPKPKKEIDVLAVARERREAEEAAAKRDQEVLEAKLGDISVEEMKKLAIVEEMEVPTRHDRAIKSNGDASDRWDERWNGRKNFKRFRRKGESGGVPRRPTQNVIVPLVEVKRKNYGIGEAYWSSSHDRDDETRNRNGRRGNVSSQTQTQAQTQTLPEEPTSPTMTRLQQEAAEIVGAIDVDKPRQTRLADKTQQSQQTMNSSRGKRPASFAATGTAKKQRTIRTRAASDSESDEELRFKFGNRKR